ncbi:tyrosine-type recombinase/integrase [Yeguia hominis]|uniref:Site-specific integrase n=1 Tax=Yeguia hominis TaxID=2763662 RepID=A0A926DAD2_9FIRM|nr:site-specific integrase [Yeguia hominis]MBC8534252.1 site-specific integrase [Yeguia hominis]
MASIVKRKNRYSVVYTVRDERGNTRQKWETYDTNSAAEKRKAQIEFEQMSGTFIVPSAKAVADLLEEYTSVYGVSTWAMSTYEARRGLMFNYIIPIIGDMKLDDLNTRVMDRFYQSLLSVKTKVTNNRKPTNEFLTVHTVREIHKLLRNAFNQAVKWELMSKNPCVNATLPKEEHKKREIWTAETLQHALEVCDDDILSLAINLSFACSLRMGEMLALTWDCVDIVFTFPHMFTTGTTDLVLKAPKTKTSVRKVFLPRTVALMLTERKKQIEKYKELFGEEYTDYNLVFCHPTGRPMENQVITRALKKLIRDNNLPDVVFHSFRHASITYKLKWNGGDMKSVQGDSGHARVEMVADVYSHIIDDDRRFNAQRFDEQFYKAKALSPEAEGKTIPMPKFETVKDLPDPMAVTQEEMEKTAEPPQETVQEKTADAAESNAELLVKLLQNPEMAALLKTLAKNL